MVKTNIMVKNNYSILNNYGDDEDEDEDEETEDEDEETEDGDVETGDDVDEETEDGDVDEDVETGDDGDEDDDEDDDADLDGDEDGDIWDLDGDEDGDIWDLDGDIWDLDGDSVQPDNIIYTITIDGYKINKKIEPITDDKLLWIKKEMIEIDICIDNYNQRQGFIMDINENFIYVRGLLADNIFDLDIIKRSKIHYIVIIDNFDKRSNKLQLDKNNSLMKIINSDNSIFSLLPSELLDKILELTNLCVCSPTIDVYENNIYDILDRIKYNGYNVIINESIVSDNICNILEQCGLLNDILDTPMISHNTLNIKNNFNLYNDKIEIVECMPYYNTIFFGDKQIHQTTESILFDNISLINLNITSKIFSDKNKLLEQNAKTINFKNNNNDINKGRLSLLKYGTILVVILKKRYLLDYNTDMYNVVYYGYTDNFMICKYEDNGIYFDLIISLNNIKKIKYMKNGNNTKLERSIKIDNNLGNIYIYDCIKQRTSYVYLNIVSLTDYILEAQLYNDFTGESSDSFFIDLDKIMYILFDNSRPLDKELKLKKRDEINLIKYIKKHTKNKYIEDRDVDNIIGFDDNLLFITFFDIDVVVNEIIIDYNNYISYKIPFNINGEIQFSEIYDDFD